MSDTIYPYSILFIEDESAVRKNYCEYLRMFFVQVYEAKDGEEGYAMYIKYAPDILIIDINIPKLNGIELLKRIRQKDYQVKAIMLTASSEVSNIIDAASLKLVKFLVKPINRKELIESLYITIDELSSYRVLPIKNIELSACCYWSVEESKLIYKKEEIQLTPKERAFLTLLLSHVGKTFTYDEISLSVWGYDEEGSINSIKSLVKKIRKKIPENLIENVFAVGFKINSFSRKVG